MPDFDDAVLECFIKNQGQLFPEGNVCEDLDDARDFLEENFAVVLSSLQEVIEYFEEEGLDLDGMDEDSILDADEVFEIGDGRYLVLEG